ncbi:AgmX/PglI C-terminal domain-containing protein [Myxococcota bacterium]
MRHMPVVVTFAVVAWIGCEGTATREETTLADPPSGAPLPKAETVEQHTVPTTEPVIGMGALPKEVIQAVINSRKDRIRRCYGVELQRNKNLAGKVTVKWVITATGTVGPVNVTSSTLGNAKVEMCMTKEIQKWRFPAPAGGGIVEVAYPFEF